MWNLSRSLSRSYSHPELQFSRSRSQSRCRGHSDLVAPCGSGFGYLGQLILAQTRAVNYIYARPPMIFITLHKVYFLLLKRSQNVVLFIESQPSPVLWGWVGVGGDSGLVLSLALNHFSFVSNIQFHPFWNTTRYWVRSGHWYKHSMSYYAPLLYLFLLSPVYHSRRSWSSCIGPIVMAQMQLGSMASLQGHASIDIMSSTFFCWKCIVQKR